MLLPILVSTPVKKTPGASLPARTQTTASDDPVEQMSLQQIGDQIRTLSEHPDQNFFELGACLNAVKSRKLFQSDYLSFGDYVRAGCPFGWRTANYMMRVAQRLDAATCARLGYSRARMVASIDDARLRAETVDAIESLTVREAAQSIVNLRRNNPGSFSRLAQPSPRQISRAFVALLTAALSLEGFERRAPNLEKHLLRGKRKGDVVAAEILQTLRQGEPQRQWQTQIEQNLWVLEHVSLDSLGGPTRQALQRVLKRGSSGRKDERQLKLY